jgi:hypothetical protein
MQQNGWRNGNRNISQLNYLFMKVAKLPDEFKKFAPNTKIPDTAHNIQNNDCGVTEIKETEVKDLETNHVFPDNSAIASRTINYTAPNNIWGEYDFHDILKDDVNRKEKKLTKDEMERYEWFCAGYLYYYDTILRNEAVDHVIYFKWEPEKVTIYMHPAPNHAIAQNYVGSVTTTTDPPKPPAPPPPPLNK